MSYRIEKDTIGKVEVPQEALLAVLQIDDD